MARKKHNPGCPCCDAECFDETYTTDYSSFANADGSYSTDRWSLPSGDNIESAAVPGGAESWFHIIHIKNGDCDLAWDGITISFRSGTGTISDGTNSSIFVSDSDLGASWQEGNAAFGTFLTLWVTPGWYCLMVRRTRSSPIGTVSSRGSVQTIDRDNTSATKPLKVTAVGGDLGIVSWRIAESSVLVSGSAITRECAKPDRLPSCTEHYLQSQSDLPNTFFALCTVDRYEIVEVSPFVYECQYLDTISNEKSTIRGFFAPNDPLPTINVDGCGADGALVADADLAGDSSKNPGLEGGFASLVAIRDSTAISPYPKAVSIYSVSMGAGVSGGSCGGNPSEKGVSGPADVAYNAEGKAPAMFDLSLDGLDDLYFNCYTLANCPGSRNDEFPPVRVLVDAELEWEAE